MSLMEHGYTNKPWDLPILIDEASRRAQREDDQSQLESNENTEEAILVAFRYGIAEVDDDMLRGIIEYAQTKCNLPIDKIYELYDQALKGE